MAKSRTNSKKADQAGLSSIDEYIAAFPADIQEILKKIRETIKKAAPAAEEAIKYGMPAFVLNGNLVFFAAWKKHIALYPAPRGNDRFKDELQKYEGGKGTLKFPINQRIPFGLITKIVKFRVNENLKKAKARRTTK